MKNKTRFLFITLLILAITGFGGYSVLQSHIKNQAFEILDGFGFEYVEIGNIAYPGAYISFEDITLGRESFSSIKNIRINLGSLNPFSKTAPDIFIDGMELTGTLSFPNQTDISGWKPPRATPKALRNANITLNDARLDLMTKDGAIRLEAKGLIKTNENGTTEISGALWGIQHQLNIDTRWQGLISADGTHKYDIEILKGTLNLDYLSVSRLSGHATLEWSPQKSLPVLNGELRIGKLGIGGNPFNSAKLQFKGPVTQQNIVLEGYIPGKNLMQIGARLQQKDKNTQVQAAINARHLNDLMSFLHQVRTNVNQSQWGIGLFMPLMLTKGNLDRIENDMTNIPYDELQLVMTGSLRDMTGKIVAYRKNGTDGERHVISLDPGLSSP